MKVGDIVKCTCATDTRYKGVPGIVVEITTFSTEVLISGKVLRLCFSQLEAV